jgi:hypothetical protein
MPLDDNGVDDAHLASLLLPGLIHPHIHTHTLWQVLLRLIGMHKGMAAKARKRELHIPDSAPLPPFDTMSAWGATSPSHGSHTHGSSPTQGAAVAASIAAMSAAAGGGQDIPFIPDNSQGYLFDVKVRKSCVQQPLLPCAAEAWSACCRRDCGEPTPSHS